MAEAIELKAQALLVDEDIRYVVVREKILLFFKFEMLCWIEYHLTQFFPFWVSALQTLWREMVA